MKALMFTAAALAAAGSAHAAAAAPAGSVRLENLAARVVVVPEARTDVKVEIRPGASDIAVPRLEWRGGEAVLRGGLSDDDLKNCRRSGRHGSDGVLLLKHRRNVAVKDLPTVVLHTPRDVVIAADAAVFGEIGAANSVQIVHERCGGWNIGDVADRLSIELEGAADIRAGRVGRAALQLEGMGDVELVSARALNVQVEGMGDVTVGQVSGPVEVSLEGMGDVHIKGGHASTMIARLEGMGDIRFDGVADSLDASADGMGDINIARVNGSVRKSQSGFAKVRVGGR